MAFFLFKARDLAGRAVKGQVEAESISAAAGILHGNNYIVIDILPKHKRLKKDWILAGQKIGVRDLSIYCRQFSTMIEAGVPLINCLSILSTQSENRRLKGASMEIILELQRGSTLAQALRNRQDIFPVIFVNMIEAGETGGILAQVLLWLAEHFEKEFALKEKIKTAMTYPAMVMAVSFMVIMILLMVIVPNFINIFQDLHVPVPMTTSVVFSFSTFTRQYWYIFLILLFLTAVLVRHLRNVRYKQECDRIVFKVPVFGSLVRKIAISQFSRTFFLLIRSGVPIITSLEAVKKASDNTVLKTALAQAQDSIRGGDCIAAPLEKSGFFPPLVTGMISVGEQAGTLEILLEKVAVFYEREVESEAARLSSIVEPVFILGTGAVVGLMVVSIMLPILDIISSVR